MKEKKKNKKWTKRRHKFSWALINAIAKPICKFKYHLHYKKFKESKNRQFLVLINHQTPFDQFFFSLMFSGKKAMVVTEDVMRNGFISSMLRFMIAPIPFRKSSNDIKAVMSCIKVAKEGAHIFISPEGNRTYSGKTGYIKPSISKLAKMLKLPIAILKFDGGYSVQPRWSDVTRKGSMKAFVETIIEPNDFLDLSDEQLFELIQQKLYHDESGDTGIYKSKRRAEYLERAMYVCPDCGLSTFESCKEKIVCKKCGKTIIYNENKLLTSQDNDFPFTTVGEWYNYQCDYIKNIDITKYFDTPAYTESVNLFKVFEDKAKLITGIKLKFSLYGDKFFIEGKEKSKAFEFDNISAVTCLGRNKLDFYYKDSIYQIRGGKRFNALKYMNFFYTYKTYKGENDGKFLGL